MAELGGRGHGRVRVVLHLDLDCFYAQVEQRRLGIPASEPVAVQQWGSLLAVNYAARKFGVKRSEHISDAKKKCPAIHLPHVDTLGENRRPGEPFDRTHQKAILRRYRVASREIFAVLGRFASVIEKAGIDEAFLDVTDLAIKRLADTGEFSPDFCADPANQDTKVFGISTMDGIGSSIEADASTGFPLTEDEQLMCVGAVISREIRAAVFKELGFTCSTGIASNKLLSKLASPLNKPDGQTVIAPRFVSTLMQCFPLRKVRGLGGKLGRQLVEIYQSLEPPSSSTPEQTDKNKAGSSPDAKPDLAASALLHRCSINDLAKHLGRETAVFVHRVCSGDDGDEPVNEKKQEVKEFSSVKQFDHRNGSALVRVEQLEYWTRIIAEEVILRCEDERVENKRFPTQLVLRYGRENQKPHSRTLPIAQDTTVDELHAASMAAMRQHLDVVFPLAYLTMSARGFMSLDSRGVSSISSFFSKAPAAGASKAESIENELKQLAPPSSLAASSLASKRRKISVFFGPASGAAPSVGTMETDADDQGTIGAETELVAASTCALGEEVPGSFHCDRCGKRVTEPRDEHEDFHFALALSRADRASIGGTSGGTDGSTSSISSIGKRKKPAAGAGPLDAFVVPSAAHRHKKR